VKSPTHLDQNFVRCKLESEIKIATVARHRWLTPVILATQDADIGRIEVRSQSGKLFARTYLGKNSSQKRAGVVAQGVGPESKCQYKKKKKKSAVSQGLFWRPNLLPEIL
jgi:hypothetical protein